MNHKYQSTLAAAALSLAAQSAQAAPSLQTDGLGNILGYDGVTVNGTDYDVRFADGSCEQVFAPCDATTVFPFDSQQLALDAIVAVATEVGKLQPADLQKIPGCETTGQLANAFCVFLTPFSVSGPSVEVAGTHFSFLPQGPQSVTFSFGIGVTDDSYTYMNWSLASPVPEPSAAAMTLLGLGAVVAAARRRRSR